MTKAKQRGISGHIEVIPMFNLWMVNVASTIIFAMWQFINV